MKRLILLRHAEAQTQRAGLADFDRTLTGLGRTEALDAAECLRRTGVRLDAMLASPAARARETALIVAARLDYSGRLVYDPSLYPGDAETLLLPLRQCEPAQSALLIGHNPGLSALARQLASALPTDGGAAGASDPSPYDSSVALPTAGMCCVHFAVDSWSALTPAAVSAVSRLN